MMPQLTLLLLLFFVQITTTTTRINLKCGGLRHFKEKRVDLAVPKLIESQNEDRDTVRRFRNDVHNTHANLDHTTQLLVLAASFGMMARKLSAVEGKEEMEMSALRNAVMYFEKANEVSETKNKIECGSDSVFFEQEQIVRSHGDALAWLGKKKEAQDLFRNSKIWPLDYLCRPRYQYPQKINNLPYVMNLRKITKKDAYFNSEADIVNHGWISETAGLHRGKRWFMKFLFINGKPQQQHLKDLVDQVPALNLRNGQIKLSMMTPGTIVRPHAGPTNARLRVHCVLHNDVKSKSYIRVGNKIQYWNKEDNPCFVFRESCEHEVYIDPNAKSNRIILIVDFANPYLLSFESYLSVLNDNVDVSAARETYSGYHSEL